MADPQQAKEQAACAADYVAELIRAAPSLLWVALAFWAIWYLYPKILNDIVPRLRSFKGFGVEAEFVGEKLADAIRAKGVDVPFGDRRSLARRIALAPQVWQGARLLWVDDTPAGLRAEQSLFESLDAVITFATTSADGLAALNRSAFDVVLSDMGREGRRDEGVLFAERVWQTGRPAPVIIYTSEDQAGKGVPPFVFGITNRPDALVHLVMDVLERARG